MKKWIIGVTSLLVLVAVGLFQFDRLGGFNEIEVESLESFELKLQGLAYRGTPQDEKLGQTFEQVIKLAKEESIPFYTIYVTEPAGKLDTMEVFVGVEFDRILSEFEKKSFQSSQAVLAKINAHRFVMPGPNKVKNKIFEFSKENNLKSPTIFIDKIVAKEEVHVIGIIEN
ncbi:hypothetical protein [Belliella aquatica]|uniref:GyrI-like small molecule binding domain-containing protein n=1 Tax=Belliella aquatica TaxID=1323734 RepID=A0ABQ1MTK6_9BACT|nr:hypothetical protein [Belliella aquatica]MCH7406523.1 hypothetical protein [Belliella aquatica]GGC46661.1 hypothetical protein GCM10010993_26610 [Belliella aquatica]